MKTIQTNTVAVTIAKGLLGIFAVAVLMFAVLPTLLVYADESGEVSDAGGDASYEPWPDTGYGFNDVQDAGGDTGFYEPYPDTGYGFNDVVDAGGDTSFEPWPDVDYGFSDVVDAGGDTSFDVTVSDAGGDTSFTNSTEIAYVVYEETSYPYYYGTGYNGYTGFSGGYSYTYPDYRDEYNYNYNYTYRAPEPSPTCTLSVNRSSIDEGDDVRLTWSTSNATSISINNGVGTVSRSGSDTVSPSSSRTYVLVATGPGGSVWCSETVIVDEDNDRDDNDDVSCDSFTASDTRVDEGDEVTLRWRTTNADDVRINQGVGDVDDDGSEEVTIDEDTTFTLTARDGNDTDTCRVTVRVEDDNDNDRNAPRCTFHVSDTRIENGESTILSWDNDRTDRLTLKDSAGRMIADSDDDRDIDEERDALTVRPSRSTTYTLTAYNGNVRRTCELDVVVGSRVAGGISLTQVPYTGFEAGPVLTAIFYTAIVVWGLILAYVLVIRKRNEGEVTEEQDWSLENIDPIEVSETHEHTVPANLPIVSDDASTPATEAFQSLEAYAHEHYALVSSDALRFIGGQGDTDAERVEILDRVINLAKSKYPKEGDWVVINKERVLAVLA